CWCHQRCRNRWSRQWWTRNRPVPSPKAQTRAEGTTAREQTAIILGHPLSCRWQSRERCLAYHEFPNGGIVSSELPQSITKTSFFVLASVFTIGAQRRPKAISGVHAARAKEARPHRSLSKRGLMRM